MTILNLNGPAGRAPRMKNSARAWMGVGLVIAVLGIGSTFASTISINSGNDTEFGQGVQRTVYCGGDNVSLKVTPVSAYKNKSGASADPAGTFYLTGIKVSEIPTACDGVNFVVSIYNTTADSSALTLATNSSTSKSLITPTVYWRNSITNTSGVYTYKGSSSSAAASDSTNCQNASANKIDSSGSGALLSLSRTSYDSPCSLAYLTVKSNAFQVNIKTGGYVTNSDIIAAGRIVIETQEDAFGANVTKTNGVSGSYGLAYDGLS